MRSVADLKNDSILIVAAEASSCMYAKLFMERWKSFSPSTQFYGVGDQQMQSEGMDCTGLAEELAVVGLQEVISHWSEIKIAYKGILEKAKKNPPRFALLLDYPGFNLRLAKDLKELGIPVVYYISPQLWAWKKGRVHKVKKYVDDMMVVFPFEVDFYRQYGIEAHFVGHPLVEVVDAELAKRAESTNVKPVLGLMPGSRKSEIKFNLATQLKTAQRMAKTNDLSLKLLVAPTLNLDFVKSAGGSLLNGVTLVQESPSTMIQNCDLILAASGTATLQVALCEKPMVVMYRMNAVTAFLARLLVRSVDAFCIVNLIAKKKIVPEFFQDEANPEDLSTELLEILDDPLYRNEMLSQLKEVKTGLGHGGATENLVNYLKDKYV